MRVAALAILSCVVVTATALVLTVALRPPDRTPIAVSVPDLAFYVPGIHSLVEWEAARDARREFRENGPWLLGYKHGPNVGELGACSVQDYQKRSSEHSSLPEWIGSAVIGVMTLECTGNKKPSTYRVTVVECGSPFDVYQVVYCRTFNQEMLRLVVRS